LQRTVLRLRMQDSAPEIGRDLGLQNVATPVLECSVGIPPADVVPAAQEPAPMGSFSAPLMRWR
jgi:hypothetical protein